MTLFEIELLMQKLQKHVPEDAHVLFGAAIDPAMGNSLSLTLISALPEDALAMAPREMLSRETADEPPPVKPVVRTPEPEPEPVREEPAAKAEVSEEPVAADGAEEVPVPESSGERRGVDLTRTAPKFTSPLTKLRDTLSGKQSEGEPGGGHVV